QYLNMFDKFLNIDYLKEEFDLISNSIGLDINDIKDWGSEEFIFKNEIAQPLMVGYSVLLKRIFLDMGFYKPDLCLGYSVGEISANLFSESISSQDALKISVNRARFMNASVCNENSQGLISIRGIGLRELSDEVEKHELFISIVNGIDHFVVGGHNKNLKNIQDELEKNRGCKITKINVNVASHTPLLKKSEDLLYQYLDNVEWKRTDVKVISGIDGRSVNSKEDFKVKFSKQVSSTINWVTCIKRLIEQEVKMVVEIGPGKSMKNIILNNNLGV